MTCRSASPTTAIGTEPMITLIARRQSNSWRASALPTPRTKAETIRMMSRRKNSTAARMAPIWITAVNAVTWSESVFRLSRPSAMVRWPVLEIGQELGHPFDDAEDSPST